MEDEETSQFKLAQI